VNLFLTQVESGTGKAPFVLQSIPGYAEFAVLGYALRGSIEVNGRFFVVAGPYLFELYSDGTNAALGTLSSNLGPVDMAQGLEQLVIVDGASGYVLRLNTNAFTRISSPGWRGSVRVAFLGGFFLFVAPETQQFYWSAIDDATTLDALDFASAESAPDDIVGILVDHRDVMLLGTKSVEGWRLTGTSAVFERNEGAIMEIGLCAPFAVQKVDSTFIWVGNDENGQGQVWMADGYRPVPIGSEAISTMLQAADLSQAVAYTYQQDGHSFYCLNAPGLETTLVFDVKTQQWHDRAELDDGSLTPIRGTCHAFCFGKHFIGADDGKVYYLDKNKHTLNGNVLVRERTSPHNAAADLSRIEFARFTLDCIVGEGKPDMTAPVVQMRYSNDGGKTWSAWREASLGALGEYASRVIFRRLGMGRDRVWQVRVTDDAPFSIVNAVIE
jgi:hypothetical protein